jgi:hypothetical protein
MYVNDRKIFAFHLPQVFPSLYHQGSVLTSNNQGYHTRMEMMMMILVYHTFF